MARGWYHTDFDHAYRDLQAHALACSTCRDDLTLVVVSLRITGELRGAPTLCFDGSALLLEATRLRRMATARLSTKSDRKERR